MNKQEKQLYAIIMALLFALLALGIAGTGDIEAEEDSAGFIMKWFARVTGPTMRTGSQNAIRRKVRG